MKPGRETLAKFQSLIALALMVVVLSVAADNFLTVGNGLNVLRQISINLCLSLGMTLVILSGGIDLSVGSVLALSGAVAAGLLKPGLGIESVDTLVVFTPFGSMVAGVSVGLVLGACNGVAITRFGLPPFVATLGMLSIARGLTMLWTGGFPITELGPVFSQLGNGQFLGIPVPVWVSGSLMLLAAGLTRRTRFGRHIFAVGGNERAAALSGLNVPGIKFSVYALAGGLAGVAGLLQTGRLNSADPNAGISYELDSIAAVVIGGTSLSGGRGSITGTAIGCLIIGVLNSGLVLLDVSPFWQQVVKGAVILIAVALDRAGARRNAS